MFFRDCRNRAFGTDWAINRRYHLYMHVMFEDITYITYAIVS